MDISRFFIDRPRFATVLSIFIFLVGALSIFQLPISEYPEVAPPQVVVRAQFPGANPRVISETVATPLEEQINGIENLLYFESQATADGAMTLTVTFKIGTNPEVAETAVQNRINRALPRLPEIVRQIGVTTEKQAPNLTMVVHLVSPGQQPRRAVPAQLRPAATCATSCCASPAWAACIAVRRRRLRDAHLARPAASWPRAA